LLVAEDNEVPSSVHKDIEWVWLPPVAVPPYVFILDTPSTVPVSVVIPSPVTEVTKVLETDFIPQL
jgi:hypothetical protein